MFVPTLQVHHRGLWRDEVDSEELRLCDKDQHRQSRHHGRRHFAGGAVSSETLTQFTIIGLVTEFELSYTQAETIRDVFVPLVSANLPPKLRKRKSYDLLYFVNCNYYYNLYI